MKKIIVLAYQISPFRGSEYSVAWNYVTEMSKDNELVVLYGASGNHMGDFDDFEKNLKFNGIKNVLFLAIKPNIFARTINVLNKKDWFSYAFYFAYRIWHLQAYNIALQLTKNEKFDLIHFLNPIGYREPGYLWKINIPYMWGPISGTVNRPILLFKGLSTKEKVFFQIRNWINTLQFIHNSRLKNALLRTDLLLTATTENQKKIQDYYNKSSIYFPENGIVNSSILFPSRKINLDSNDIINILWIGSIDARKSLIILLDALAMLNINNWKLHVIGDGPKKISMQNIAKQVQIENNVVWHGQITREDVFNLLQLGHLNVISSLGEGNPTTIWEAMANGIPTIALNHCGMKDVICEKCGIRIDISSYDQVINDIADVLSDLLENPNKINILSEGVNECIGNFTWEMRRKLFNQFYNTAIENWKQKNETIYYARQQ